jgi:hypothetical protein
VRAYASAEAQRATEELVEDRSGGAVCQCRLVRRADLAQQLLLGNDRRVESPDDLKHAPDGLTPSHISSRGRGVIDAHELNSMAGVQEEALDGGDAGQLLGVGRALVDRQIAKGREPNADVVQIGAGS